MKTITTILLALTILSLNAQEKLTVGIQIEGIYSTPLNLNFFPAKMNKDFGEGVGVYLSRNIWKSVSVNAGLNYRTITYNHLDQNVMNQTGNSSLEGYKYKQDYWVVPVNLRKCFLSNWLFIEPGIEFNWIIGRADKDPKMEILWKIGAGSKIGKLNYSLNYLWGNKEQSDFLNPGPDFKVVMYKSRMFQFKVSYPLWQKK